MGLVARRAITGCLLISVFLISACSNKPNTVNNKQDSLLSPVTFNHKLFDAGDTQVINEDAIFELTQEQQQFF